MGRHILRVLMAGGEVRKPKCYKRHNRIFRGFSDFQGLKSPRTSEHTFTLKHTHTSCTTSRGFGWRPLRCRG
jgi:hypothetical protein